MKKVVRNFNKTKLLLIFVLFAILTFFVSMVTYAWFKDSVDLKNPTVVTTGKIDVTLTAYKKTTTTGGNSVWLSENLYDSTPDGATTPPQQDSALLSSSLYTLDLNSGSDEIYFVVNKFNQSINVDLALSFVLNTEDVFINGFSYYLTKIEVPKGKTVEDVLNEESQKTVTPTLSLNNINGDVINATLNTNKTEESIIFRLTCNYASGNVTENAYTDKYYPLQINFSVGQIGSITGEFTGETWRVSSEAELRNALLNYQTNDNIYIINDITYNADLILDHPVQLYVRGYTLKVNGNFNVTFADTGEFLIDTQNGGKIIVAQIGQSGNFIVDIPNAHISIVGSGNTLPGKGDIYVQNKFSILASFVRGADIYRSNIYNTDSASVNDNTTEYEDIYIGQSTLVTIASRTTVGALVAESGTTLIKVINNGIIEYADFSSMTYDVTNNPLSPQLVIENFGTIGKDGNQYSVVLNHHSTPCYTETGMQQSGNTRLIKKLGAQFLVGTIGIVGGTSNYYIETDTEAQYVQPVTEGDYTDIIVNYANLYDENSVEIPNTTLADVLAWYFNGAKENDLQRVQKMQVICYNGKVLTQADYATINSLANLVSLDLSNCTSEDNTVGSFARLSKLEKLEVPEDKTLNENAFFGTKIDEITIPESFTDIDANAFVKQDGLVKYVHLKGFSTYSTITPNEGQYLFVADQALVDEYRAMTDNLAIKAKIFLEAERHGDYFIRFVGNSSVEIATYIGESFDYESEKIRFDFSSFYLPSEDSVEGIAYDVLSYDDFAFYNKLTTGNAFDLVMSDVSSIGSYAFYGATVFENIDVSSSSNMTIKEYAFGDIENTQEIILTSARAANIGEYAFYNASASSVTVNAQSAVINESAFENSNVTTLNITVTGSIDIAPNAFKGTKATADAPSIVMAARDVTIGESAFWDTQSKSLNVTANNVVINESAFENSNVTTLEITVTGSIDIATNAFKGTKATTDAPSIVMAARDVAIGESAFWDTQSKSLNITAKTVVIGESAFEKSSTSTLTITADSVEIKEKAFNYTDESNQTAPIVIEATDAVVIGSFAFASSQSTSLDIVAGNNANIGYAAFEYPEASGENDHVSVDKYNLLGAREVKIKSVNIDSKTVTIGNWAFRRASSLSKVYISGEGTIGTSGFYRCMALMEVVAPKITKIGQYALAINSSQGNVGALRAVVMPSLVDIGKDAFRYQQRLAYLETSIIYKVDGEQLTSAKSNHSVITKSIQLHKVVPNGMDVSTYNYLPSLFKKDGSAIGGDPYDMHLLVPSEYQSKYVDSAYGSSSGTSTNYSYVLTNSDYVGEESYLWYEDGKWVDGPAYKIDFEAKTFQMANYAYHYDANGNLQILANFNIDITQDELIIPDSVYINGEAQKITSIGPYAFRTAKIDVDVLTIGANMINLDANAFAPQYHHPGTSLNKRRYVNTLNIGGLTSLTGFVASKDFTGTSSSAVTALRKGNVMLEGLTMVNGQSTSLDAGAFKNLKNLIAVNFPNVTELVNQEFYGCTGLVSATFNSLTSVSGNVFSGCTALANVTFPLVTTVSNGAFSGCTALTEITDSMFPVLDTIGTNGDTVGAFENCGNLTGVSLTALTNVNKWAFKNCDLLSSIRMDKVITLTNGAFMGTALATVNDTMFPSIRTVGNDTDTDGVFSGCTLLTAVELTEQKTNFKINAIAFEGCSGLKTVKIANVTAVNPNWFSGHQNLETVDFEDVIELNNGEFAGCQFLKNVSFESVTTISNGAFMNSGVTEITQVNFPKLTTVGNAEEEVSAFQGSALQKFEFAEGSGLNRIIGNPFVDCAKLNYIHIAYINAMGSLNFGGHGELQTVIFDNITELNNAEFANCTKLTSATFNKCTSVSGGAFENCTALNTVYMPLCTVVSDRAFKNTGFTSLTDDIFPVLTTISGGSAGAGAFHGCTKLVTIDLPDVTSIGSYAFVSCTATGLTATFDSLKTLGSYAFGNNSNGDYSNSGIKSFTAPAITAINTYAFYNAKQLTDISIATVTSIGERAFNGCSKLATANLPNVTSIGGYAFYQCSALNSINLSSLTSFTTTYVFANCTKLASVYAPNLTTISSNSMYTFQSCAFTSINGVDWEEGAKMLYAPDLTELGGPYAFYQCTSLQKVRLQSLEGDETNAIANGVFRGCSVLESVYAPSVKTLGKNAFYQCTALKNVYMPKLTTLNGDSGGSTFYQCKSLQKVNGGEWSETANMLYAPDLDTDASNAFEGCTALTEVHLGSIARLRASTFNGCTKLKKVSLLSLAQTANDTFKNCTSLEYLYLPKLYRPTASSFANCTGLKVLYAPALGSQGRAVPSALFNGTPNLKVVYFASVGTDSVSAISNIASVCAIFENGTLTTPTTINLPIITSGANASNYLAANGYSRAQVEDLATEVIFTDADGNVITFNELFNANGTLDKVPVAVYTKSADGKLTLVRSDTIDASGSYTVPNSFGNYEVVEIADYAYYGINNLSIDNLSFGASIAKVGNDIFNNTTLIRSIDYANVASAGRMSVAGLESIRGYNLTNISDNAFAKNISLTSVDLPVLAQLPSGAFDGCTSLVSVRFPGVTEVVGGDVAVFNGCTKLASVSFGDQLVSMSGKVFDGCTSLSTVMIDNDNGMVQLLTNSVGAPGSATLTVPGRLLSNYRSNGNWRAAFANIESFQTIVVDNAITYYLDSVSNDGVEFVIANMAISDHSLMDLALLSVFGGNKKIVGIGENAMHDIGRLTNLQTLTLPTYLKYFNYKDELPISLTAFAIADDAPTYQVLDGVLYANNGSVLVCYPAGKSGDSFTVPSSVQIVTEQAFVNARNLTSVSFTGDSVLFIGDEIIAGSNIETIYVPTGCIETYRSNVLVDKDIANYFVEG